jgi:Tol biopolymer transport system component
VNSRVDPRVVFVTADGHDEDLVPDLEGGIAWHPVLSPDGGTIALSRKAPGQPWRIQTVPRTGGSLTTVLDVEYDTLWPAFHPDGKRVVFFTWPGRHRVGVVSLDGSGLEWLTDADDECGYPAVSPDGAWLAYVRGRGEGEKTDVVIRPFEGGEERVLVEGGTVPVFSPDGRMLAFAGGRTTSGRIGVVAVDGGEPRWLTTSGTWPTWMPDGREVAYTDRTSDGPQIARAVPVEGGEPRTLSSYRWPGTNYPFTIDPQTGRILSTNAKGGNPSIWLAEYDDP